MKSTLLLNNDLKKELVEIINNIVQTIPVKQIILFGSHASGIAGDSSDIDLCVITEDKRRKIEIIRDVQEAAYKTARHQLDILVYRPEEFLDRSDSIATIEKTISEKGILVYG